MKYLTLVFFCFFKLSLGQDSPKLPNAQDRLSLFNKVVSEINRLDGEGLIPRINRPESFDTTTRKLSLEAQEAKSLFEFGRVFKKLDAAYPNLHAKVHLHKMLDEKKSLGSLSFDFSIKPNLTTFNAHYYDYFISTQKTDSTLKKGDQVIAINNKSINEIQDENFIFCKFPLKSQCALELFSNLTNEILFWHRSIPLVIKIKRNNIIYDLNANFEIIDPNKKSNPTFSDDSCPSEEKIYQPFVLDFEGYNLCAYTAKNYPKTLVLRIKSFQYHEGDPITSLESEVDFFWTNYWRKKSNQFKTIIFDVIGNHGGKAPIPYYQLFTHKPFQEQYAQFKKISEFERKDILDSNFWGDKAKEIYLKNIKQDGSYDKTAEGDFLPIVPQFCADQTKDCREGLFQPYKHHFKGNIKLLMDQWTISSGTGFVDNMGKLFKGKVTTYGHPDSGDSAYSRLTVSGSINHETIKVDILALDKAKKPDLLEPWIRQIVSVTRTTDSQGNILSGKVQKIDHWIPRYWNQFDEDWRKNVFQTALKK